MKVLDDATRNWKSKIRCDGCNSKLEILDTDLLYGHFNGGYCETGKTYVKCPCCDKHIIVKTPSWLFRRVKNRTAV